MAPSIPRWSCGSGRRIWLPGAASSGTGRPGADLATRRRPAPARAPGPVPEPIVDLDELTEEVAALLGTPYQGAPLERILDGLVRLTAADGPRVRAALDPVIERRHWSWANEHRWDPLCLCETVVEVFRSAGVSRTDRRRERWEKLLTAVHRPGATPELAVTDPKVPPVHRLLRARLAEIGAHLDEPGQSGLLALPTSTNGLLDPMALLERLTALGDREPGQWDLTQALLRLPTEADETLAAKAAALGTAAGQRFAAWLRDGGLPSRSSVPHRHPRPAPGNRHWEWAYLPAERILVDLTPPAGTVDRYGLLTAPATPLGGDHSGWVHLWPSLLPRHRGVVTAYALPLVAGAADMDERDGAAVLPLLAELSARHGPDRVATVDALLTLAAAGELDAAGTGGS